MEDELETVSNVSTLQVIPLKSHPDYSFMFSFERNFDKSTKREWMQSHWHYAFYLCAVYLVVIFSVQAYMRSRKRFELQKLLIVWNLFLAIFSTIGFFRTVPEFVYILKNFGLTYSVCNPSFIEDDKVSGYWTWVFSLFKAPELFDTVFIVLRKQPLIFLHWYHHITVLLFTWYSYKEHIGVARWYIVMNFCVHSMMYSYYAVKAMRFKVPKPVAMFITTSQILQMVLGCLVTSYSFIKYYTEENCAITDGVVRYGVIMYASYFLLFANFFYKAYIKSSSKPMKVD